MKLYEVLLTEKLPLSTAKKYVKGWDKSRYEEIFKKYTDDPKAYRIYLPLQAPRSLKANVIQKKVEDVLNSKGYTLSDYVGGYAIEKDKEKPRIMKIGKLLDDEELRQKFANDSARASSKNKSLIAVISRHPYDIAGMSTDRGWRSCMNLEDGCHRDFVPIDIKEGTIVAYLIDAEDKNIEKPVARMLIKPFVNIDKPEEAVFGIENKIYGTSDRSFKATVIKWVNEVNDSKKLNGIFVINPLVYRDSEKSDIIVKGDQDEDTKKIIKDWKNIADVKNPTKAQVKLALKFAKQSIDINRIIIKNKNILII